MTFTVIFSKSFLKEMRQIAEYMQQQKLNGEIFFDGLYAKIDLLSNNPGLGHYPEKFPRFKNRGYRKLTYEKHNIFYTVRGNKIILMRLRHSAQKTV